MSEVKRYFIHTTDLRNINDDWFHNVEMSSKNLWDSGQVVELVHKEDYQKLKAQLEKAEEILKAYANCILDQTVHVSIPYDDLDPDDFDVIEEFSSGEPDDIGSKAREYFKEKGE